MASALQDLPLPPAQRNARASSQPPPLPGRRKQPPRRQLLPAPVPALPETTMRVAAAAPAPSYAETLEPKLVHAVEPIAAVLDAGPLATRKQLPAPPKTAMMASYNDLPPKLSASEKKIVACFGDAVVAEAAVQRATVERQELIQWGEGLRRAVATLEKDRAELQQRHAASALDLDQARQRCAELEKLVRQSQAISSKVLALPARESAENSELRKQLAAYAVEIDVLREEKAHEQRQIRAVQEKAHAFFVEKEEMTRQVHELERSGRDTRNRLQQLEAQLGAAGEERSKVEAQLRDAMREVTVLGASLKQEQERRADRQNFVGLQLEEAESTIGDKDKHIKDLTEMVKLLRDQLVQTQERCVQQTREYAEFVAEVRHRQLRAEEELDALEDVHSEQAAGSEQFGRDLAALNGHVAGLVVDRENARQEGARMNAAWQSTCDELKAEHGRLKEEQGRLKAEHGFAQDRLKAEHGLEQDRLEAARQEQEAVAQRLEQDAERRDQAAADKKRSRKAKLHVAFRLNNAAPMQRACYVGAQVEKISMKGKREPRRMIVEDNMGNDNKFLKWEKPSFGRKAETRLNLRNIIAIGFGYGAKASFEPNATPWHCFSLYTKERSYDFICKDGRDVEAFLITLSHLRKRISGFSLPGGIMNHRSFVLASGWCKVQCACYRRRISFARAMEMCLPGFEGRLSRLDTPPGGEASGRGVSPARSGSTWSSL